MSGLVAVGSNSINASQWHAEVEGAEPMCMASPPAAAEAAPSSSESTASQLVRQHGAASPRDCTMELIKVGLAGLAVAGSSTAMVAATPTVVGVPPGIIGFIGTTVGLAMAATDYLNCRDGTAE